MSQLTWPVVAVFLFAGMSYSFSDALPGGDPDIIIVNPNDPSISNSALQLQLSKEFSLGLPNTAGTGYIWSAQAENEAVVTLEKTRSIAVNKGNEPVVGYRTLDVFIIKPRSVGSTRIDFKLERPDGKQLSSFGIPIVVSQ